MLLKDSERRPVWVVVTRTQARVVSKRIVFPYSLVPSVSNYTKPISTTKYFEVVYPFFGREGIVYIAYGT